MAKCVLVSCGEYAKASYGSTQLCSGLEAGVEGAMHAVKPSAELNKTMEFGKWDVDKRDGGWSIVGLLLPDRLTGERVTGGDGEQPTHPIEEGRLSGRDRGKGGGYLLLVDAANEFDMLS